MIGLVIKDLISLKKQGKVMFLLMIFYLVYSVMMKSVSFLSGMIALVCAMMPVTSIAYDEQSKWDRYALSMPVSRNVIVLSKYILGVALVLLGLIITLPFNFFIIKYTGEMNQNELLLMIGVICEIALLFISVMLPILFKFGVEKGRMLMMMVFICPTFIAFLFPKLNLKLPSEQTLKLLGYLSPIFILIILLISIMVSLRIYNKKEF